MLPAITIPYSKASFTGPSPNETNRDKSAIVSVNKENKSILRNYQKIHERNSTPVKSNVNNKKTRNNKSVIFLSDASTMLAPDQNSLYNSTGKAIYIRLADKTHPDGGLL